MVVLVRVGDMCLFEGIFEGEVTKEMNKEK